MPKKKHRNKYLQAIEASIDLHGLTKDEAKSALGGFLMEAKSKKYKKVRVITGKGLHSQNGSGVLKSYVERLLEGSGLKYRDAKIDEGGSGAIDVEIP